MKMNIYERTGDEIRNDSNLRSKRDPPKQLIKGQPEKIQA